MLRFSKLSLWFAVVALNAQLCPCPALADTDIGHDPHTQHVVSQDAAAEDCHGAESRDDCDMATVEAQHLNVTKNADHTPADAPAAALPAAHLYAADPTPTGFAHRPPPPWTKSRQDPVALSDRLLD